MSLNDADFRELLDDLATTFSEMSAHVVFGDPRFETEPASSEAALLRGEALRFFSRLFAASLKAEWSSTIRPTLTSPAS